MLKFQLKKINFDFENTKYDLVVIPDLDSTNISFSISFLAEPRSTIRTHCNVLENLFFNGRSVLTFKNLFCKYFFLLSQQISILFILNNFLEAFQNQLKYAPLTNTIKVDLEYRGYGFLQQFSNMYL